MHVCENTHLSVMCSDECEPLHYFNEGKFGLQKTKPHSKAAAWASSKGHVALWRPLGLLLCSKPIETCFFSDLNVLPYM